MPPPQEEQPQDHQACLPTGVTKGTTKDLAVVLRAKVQFQLQLRTKLFVVLSLGGARLTHPKDLGAHQDTYNDAGKQIVSEQRVSR
eukprot:710241-Amphidinium_carterae.2